MSAAALAYIRGKVTAHEVVLLAAITLLARDKDQVAEVLGVAQYLYDNLPMAPSVEAKAAAAEGRRHLDVVERMLSVTYVLREEH